jgi:hypothetical protein
MAVIHPDLCLHYGSAQRGRGYPTNGTSPGALIATRLA